MCQLGAVLISTSRVFRRDGVRWHCELRELAAQEYPGEEFYEAEFDFVRRRWDWPERLDEMAEPLKSQTVLRLLPKLERFSYEQWGTAEWFIAFVRRAGLPEKPEALLTPAARRAYAKAKASAQRVYNKAVGPARQAYEEAEAAARRACANVIGPAWKARDEAVAAWNAYVEYYEAVVTAEREYDEVSIPAWCELFADPEHRIEIWR